jgi:hypothetical protein
MITVIADENLWVYAMRKQPFDKLPVPGEALQGIHRREVVLDEDLGGHVLLHLPSLQN